MNRNETREGERVGCGGAPVGSEFSTVKGAQPSRLNTRFIAIFSDTHVRVFRLTGGRQSGNPEPLSHREFERRSVANGLVWKPYGDRSAVIDADRFGAQIIATRLQLV